MNTAFGNKLHVSQANGYFDISKHQIIDLHTVPSANVVVGSSAPTALTHQSRTKVGTARIRDIDHYTASGNTANLSHSHSDYVLYLSLIHISEPTRQEAI